jgi:hypothetical protein
LSQQLPQGSDLNGEIALLDGGSLPGRLNKIGLGKHLTRAIQKSSQEKRGPIRNGDGYSFVQKRPGLGVEDEMTKSKAPARHSLELTYLFGTFQEYSARA